MLGSVEMFAEGKRTPKNIGITVLRTSGGGSSASLIAREMLPTFATEDLVGLPNYHIYLKLMIDGAPSKPFSAITIEPGEVIDPVQIPEMPCKFGAKVNVSAS